MENKVTLLILSCDKFSDLWDGHIKLLEENWSDRSIDTVIVTDKPTEKQYKNIRIMSAGSEGEWSDRLAYAINSINTDYIFITLDDYFLIKRVNNDSIKSLIKMMDKERIDYVRLFPRPKKATKEKLTGYSKIHKIDTTCDYSVNLYAGIWNRKFLQSTVKKPKNAWQFEVLLHKRAMEYGANCAVSLRNEFEILDVVRKGKLLHKSAAYFKKHPGIYSGNREVNTWSYEIKLEIQTLASRHLPNRLRTMVKSFMRRKGRKFFSDEIE